MTEIKCFKINYEKFSERFTCTHRVMRDNVLVKNFEQAVYAPLVRALTHTINIELNSAPIVKCTKYAQCGERSFIIINWVDTKNELTDYLLQCELLYHEMIDCYTIMDGPYLYGVRVVDSEDLYPVEYADESENILSWVF